SPADIDYLTSAVYARCDGFDGAEDGIISNVAQCRQATAGFKLLSADNPLRCTDGSAGGAGCLSDAQLQALNVIDTPYELGFRHHRDDPATGSVFPKCTPFEGSTCTDGGATNLGAEGPRQALQFAPGDATTRLAIAQDLSMDVIHDFDPRQFA